MDKISINYEGEKIYIKFPKDFETLKKEILERFQISLSDFSSIDFFYINDEIIKKIKSEIDYKEFIKSSNSNITVEINDSNELFKDRLEALQNKVMENLIFIEKLKKEKEKMKNNQENLIQENKKKKNDIINRIELLRKEKLSNIQKLKNPKNERKDISSIDKQIKDLYKIYLGLSKEYKKSKQSFKNEISNFEKEILNMEKSLGISSNEKKFIVKGKKSKKLKAQKKLAEASSNIQNIILNFGNNIKEELEKNIIKINKEIEIIEGKAQRANYELTEEDKNFFQDCKNENDKSLNEIDKLIENILEQSLQVAEDVESKNDIYLKKLDEIGKNIGIDLPTDEPNSLFVGAKMPYKRYDTEDALLGGNASIITSPDHSQDNIASQASNQSYIKLPQDGSYAEWTIDTPGNGITMRFTLPDTGDGRGQNGSLDVYVNNNKVKTVGLTSYYMWQYFPGGNPSDEPGGAANFAFDEVHFLLETPLQNGDKIKIQSSGANGLEYGIDFLEIEEVGDPIPQPEGSYSVIDFGANPNNEEDDYSAISECVSKANAEGKNVYFPPGTYRINQIWRLYGENIKITGAGIWYTNIQFTNDQPGTGGISGGSGGGELDGYCKNVEFCHMYINSNLRSRYNQQAVYKCFMDVWTNGYIHDIWEEHFECGFWIADYNGNMDYSDGLKIVNCRIRNNLADGVNFCQGTSSSTVYNCSIRNNGDDGLAMWNDSNMSAKDESNNVFCYNTIEFIWRAGGIAIYGGNGHKIYNNYIRDTHMSAGIHLNTIFSGHKFSNNTGIEFSNNVLIKTGSVKGSWSEEFGAIDLDGDIHNITFNNTYVYNSQHDAIHFGNGFSNIEFNNIKILGTGTDGQEGNYSSLPHKGAAIQIYGSPISVVINDITLANIACKGTMYGSTAIDNYINLNNVTINGETDLGTINVICPNPQQRGLLNTESPITIPDPETINPEINTSVLLKSKRNNELKKEITIHHGVICKICKNLVIGTRYKCAICKDLNLCEKCEEKDKGKHGHPFLKINRPCLCPIDFKCILNK